MSEAKSQTFSAGSVMEGLASAGRKTTLTIPQLIAELYAAVYEHGDMQSSNRVGRLLGTLCADLGTRLEVPPNRFSRVKTSLLVRALSTHPDISPEIISGGTFVDFGCGGLNPLASLVVLLAAGAGQCIGIDLDPLNEALALPALAKTAMELIAEPALYLAPLTISGEQVRKNLTGLGICALMKGDKAGLAKFPLEYRNIRAEATGIETASVSGITSFSFLEHVPDPDSVIREMARISKPAALGLHGIDGVDHRSYARPEIGVLDFLRESSKDALLFGCNRVRPLDFIGKFERAGFEGISCKTTRRESVSEDDRKRMVEPFRSMTLEHLSVVGVQIPLRRRP